MEKSAKIFVAGHLGLVGSALVRNLQAQGYENLLLRSREELDLMNQKETFDFLIKEKPDYAIIAAAKVGGILANNTQPAQFIYENLQIECNLIHGCHLAGVKKLLFLGSSCIYPKMCPQPMREEHLLTGPLEPTNEPYAIAKIAGIKLCQSYNRQYGTNYIAVMPTNLYGPNDNFDLNSSHVLPAVIRKFHEAKLSGAKEVVAWGSGSPLREFLYVDDMADGCIFLMDNFNPSKEENERGEIFVNLGTGKEISIRELYKMGKQATGFEGEIVWDTNKPDGTPRKLLDVSKMAKMGWKYRIDLEEGMKLSYQWFINNK